MLFRWQWTWYWCWIFCGSVEMVLENYKIWIKLDLSFPLFHFSRRFLPQDKDIQNSRYVVDPKFCHFVRPIPSVTILCPNIHFGPCRDFYFLFWKTTMPVRYHNLSVYLKLGISASPTVNIIGDKQHRYEM